MNYKKIEYQLMQLNTKLYIGYTHIVPEKLYKQTILTLIKHKSMKNL